MHPGSFSSKSDEGDKDLSNNNKNCTNNKSQQQQRSNFASQLHSTWSSFKRSEKEPSSSSLSSSKSRDHLYHHHLYSKDYKNYKDKDKELQICSKMAEIGWNNPYCSSTMLKRYSDHHSASSKSFSSLSSSLSKYDHLPSSYSNPSLFNNNNNKWSSSPSSSSSSSKKSSKLKFSSSFNQTKKILKDYEPKRTIGGSGSANLCTGIGNVYGGSGENNKKQKSYLEQLFSEN